MDSQKISYVSPSCKMSWGCLLWSIWSHSSLTHWGRVTHICVNKLATIDSDNGLSPGRCQAIISTNAGIMLIGLLRTYFSEILLEVYIFSFTKIHLKMSSGNWQPFCPSLKCVKHNQASTNTTSLTPTHWYDLKIKQYIYLTNWRALKYQIRLQWT